MFVASRSAGRLIALCLAGVPLQAQVPQIRQEYQLVRRALPSLRVDSTDLGGFSTEGGVAKAYRDSTGDIRLVEVILYGEMGKQIAEYYYRQQVLFFVYTKDLRYNVPFTFTPDVAREMGSEPFDPKKTKVLENRYYFSEGHLLRWIGEYGRQIDVRSEQARDAASDLISFADTLRAKFR